VIDEVIELKEEQIIGADFKMESTNQDANEIYDLKNQIEVIHKEKDNLENLNKELSKQLRKHVHSYQEIEVKCNELKNWLISCMITLRGLEVKAGEKLIFSPEFAIWWDANKPEGIN